MGCTDWTGYVEDLLLQTGNQDIPALWQESKQPSASVGRAAGRNPNAEIVKGPQARGGFFEHSSGIMSTSEALKQLGCEFL